MYVKRRVEINDGELMIVGHLYQPDEPGDNPCVVICHEFGFDQNWEISYASELARRSYTVFTFDFPGSGNGCSRGRETTEMSILTEVSDLIAVCGYLKKRLMGRRLVLCGFSMGGAVSALAAAKIAGAESDLAGMISGLILVYPALSIADDARRGRALGARFDASDPPETFWTKMPPVRLGRRFVEDALKTEDWMDTIGRYTGPVLLIHGENDRVVPIIYSEIAASLYRDVRLVRLPHAGHIFWQPWVRKKALQRMIVFLRQITIK